MENNIKLASYSIDVPYKGAGNVIRQHPVLFDVFKDDTHFNAVPQLSLDERRKANLPEALLFSYENGKAQSTRKLDGNFHIIEEIVAKLQQTSVLNVATGA